MKSMTTLIKIEGFFLGIHLRLSQFQEWLLRKFKATLEFQVKLRKKALDFMALEKERMEVEVEALEEASQAYDRNIKKITEGRING